MVEPMEVLQLEACAEELAAASNATPIIDAATRAVRQARAVQLDEVRFIVDSGAYFTRGHRSVRAEPAISVTPDLYGGTHGGPAARSMR